MAAPKSVLSDESTPIVVTATEFAENLSDILNRVKYKGERFQIQRNGEVIALLSPQVAERVATFGDFLDFMRSGPRPDDQFAKDLKAVLAELPKVDFSEYHDWPD